MKVTIHIDDEMMFEEEYEYEYEDEKS